MSYHERVALVSAGSSVVITLTYTAYRIQFYPAGDPYAPEVFQFWGGFFLLLILVSIAGRIIIRILFSIINTITTQEEEPGIVDERDRLIEMKARPSIYVFVGGFMLAMAALAAGLPPAVMFVLIFVGGFASDVLSELLLFIYYRRGV
jgi:hypothetical protein